MNLSIDESEVGPHDLGVAYQMGDKWRYSDSS